MCRGPAYANRQVGHITVYVGLTICADSLSRERESVVTLRRRPGRPAPESGHAVTLVTRAGCHLCEVAEATLRRLRDELGFDYAEVDVDAAEADPALPAEYSDRVPVILIDGREHGYWRVEEPRFRKALAKPVRA